MAGLHDDRLVITEHEAGLDAAVLASAEHGGRRGGEGVPMSKREKRKKRDGADAELEVTLVRPYGRSLFGFAACTAGGVFMIHQADANDRGASSSTASSTSIPVRPTCSTR